MELFGIRFHKKTDLLEKIDLALLIGLEINAIFYSVSVMNLG